ncbi:MAG TPA: outer membrane beta-barrel protein [Terracidiphilus sp.]|jgi:opacity protein-like surface antigen
MHNRWIQAAILAVGFGAAGSAIASAQVSEVSSLGKTDVAVSIYGAFGGTTTGDGVAQSPSNAAGGIVEMRHIANPLVGFEGTYSFNRANQVYALYPDNLPCPAPGGPCGPLPTAVSADAHEVTGDWVASLKIANLRPFALAGGGLLFNEPSSGQADTTSSNKPVFVYGAGLDWGLLPHIGLRLQYRGNLYRAPDLTTLYGSSGAFTHTAEPMIGIYLRL